MEKTNINVLIACEESQTICKAFRALGVRAFSCDLQECSGGFPQWHIKGDCKPVIETGDFVTEDGQRHSVEKWTLIIAHPPCTYLSNAGAKHLWRNHQLNAERYAKGLQGREFFMYFYDLPQHICSRVLIENPIPSKIYDLPKKTQVIQPYEYGDPFSKRTYLWLRNLPNLKPTEVLNDYIPFCTSGSYTKSHNPKYKGYSRKGGSSRSRSKTFKGIALAIAQQYTHYLLEEEE